MTEPISLVRAITWLPVGGIERRLVSVLPRLRDRGYAPRLVCLREFGPLATELRDHGIPVDLVKLRSRLDPRGLRALSHYMRDAHARIVHSHMYRANVPATIAARRARVPVVFAQVHNVGTWETPRQRALDRFLCRWRTGVVCVSKAVQEDVRAALDLSEQRAPVLYNGCDTVTFAPDEALRRRTRESLGLADDETVALVPARLHPQKCPLQVLAAFGKATASLAGRTRLLFAGAGALEPELRAAIAERGLGDRVTMLGRRDDMPALYNASDVVVLSSTKEGFSNAVVEALACGRPVIAADVGGNKEALGEDGSVGWIHEAEDWPALERQFAEALGNREALTARYAACRARGERFSLAQLVEATDAMYRAALARVPAAGGA